MKLLLTMTRRFGCLAVCMLTCFIIIDPAFSLDKQTADQDKRVSFEFHGQTMAEVANQISKQFNYKVLMDEDLSDLPITGLFKDVTLNDFFSRRLFYGMNIAIVFDSNKRTVAISSLGKKSRMTEYNRTNNIGTDSANIKSDPMDMEIQPGIMRRDVIKAERNIDPMDQEVQPGIRRQDVVQIERDIDPMDQEIQPGIRRGDIVQALTLTETDKVEIQPGIKRSDIIKVPVDTDPLDMEIQPGIKRRDVRKFTLQ